MELTNRYSSVSVWLVHGSFHVSLVDGNMADFIEIGEWLIRMNCSIPVFNFISSFFRMSMSLDEQSGKSVIGFYELNKIRSLNSDNKRV
ncbi:hypothetical protein LX69_01846 [Breznakibacter xylanolyticus]|uniref:Uncharacterized protein n=1 Tax=Breznakibacter xylanolyticus TaxID=990 RepID=A0A2W7NTW9_9BACT|nr:hypothetical protein LX69_01846 [Breznakibacter xylanolyticus]